jgi:hypothetical protein
MKNLTQNELEFIIQCIQTYQSSPYYKEDRYGDIIESILNKIQ